LSGITGLFNRNGQTANSQILDQMAQAAVHRGPDGIEHWISGPVGLVQSLLACTSESRDEKQPLVDPESCCCIVFDGRVDNRVELSEHFRAHNIPVRDYTDMALVLAAYLAWGDQCAARILGDFAFSIWDQRNECFFCARDVVGIKPFYYTLKDEVFLFGSETQQLLSHPDVSTRLNEGMLAEVLNYSLATVDETVFQEIQKLPAAHCLIVRRDYVKLWRYWDLDSVQRLEYRHFDQYVDHFQEIFRESVNCRLRVNGPLGAFLSGGIDSTTVAAIAQSLLNESGGGDRLQTFSAVFPGVEYSDERPFIGQVVDECGLESRLFRFSADHRFPDWEAQSSVLRGLPMTPISPLTGRLLESAQSSGIRVMLGGVGASTVLGGSDYLYLDLLRRGKWSTALRELKYDISTYGWRTAWQWASRSFIWPCIPVRLKRRLVSRISIPAKWEFLTDEFARSVGLEDRLSHADNRDRFRHLSAWEMESSLFSSWAVNSLELADMLNSRYGIEERSPFFDRRVIEFAAAVPVSIHLRADQDKRLVRALAGQLLSEKLARRVNFAHFLACHFAALKTRAVEQVLQSLDLAKAGYISQDNVSKQYTRLIATNSDIGQIQDIDWIWLDRLWYVYAAELLFRRSIADNV
jgi:asparagine synthase (glutamine-hydrolysing)